jgi:uncharacterized membrane protein YhaH (DUF805 family)
MEWYRMVWQKYAQFDGRSRRKEYWMFTLINFLVYVALIACILVAYFAAQSTAAGIAFGVICCLYGLAAIIPGLAVTVRRLHDIGRTGWWLLICLVPGGGLVIFVFSVLEGTPGPNGYGPDPKAATPYPGQPIPIG